MLQMSEEAKSRKEDRKDRALERQSFNTMIATLTAGLVGEKRKRSHKRSRSNRCLSLRDESSDSSHESKSDDDESDSDNPTHGSPPLF